MHAARNNISHLKRLWRCAVSAAVITGIVLVFALLGYLIYALLNAEEF
nr:K(+)-transporting ATPase subunit F [Pantoea coffeiphila]